jgi:hypothetical protein
MTFGNAQFKREFPQTPDLLHRYPDAAPDRGRLEIPFINKAVNGRRRDREIGSHLIGLLRYLQHYQTKATTYHNFPRVMTSIKFVDNIAE